MLAVLGVLIIAAAGAGFYIVNNIAAINTTAANTALETSGIKDQATQYLDENIGAIATVLGIPLEDAQEVVDNIAVEDWTIIELPKDAVIVGSFSYAAEGLDVEVTTHKDDSYVTFRAAGIDATFTVPVSAREYLAYLSG